MAHWQFAEPGYRSRYTVLVVILTLVSMETDPVTTLTFQPLLTPPEIIQIIGVNHGRWRIDQIVILQ